MRAGWTNADWAVLGAYFLLLLGSGIYFSRQRSASSREYFVGGGTIPVWAAAVSFLSTALSAATFIGVPQQTYKGDLTYLSANLGSFIAILIVAFVFIPVYYREKVSTVYELLGRRFGPHAQRAAGGAFLVGRLFASGARLYIGALPIALLLFGDVALPHLFLAIVLLALAASLYGLHGGIKSVIWTDVVQTVVFMGAALAALLILWQRVPADGPTILHVLEHPAPGVASKLTVLRFDTGGVYNLWTALIGFTLFNLAAYGTDHDLAQRLLTCSSAAKASRSALLAVGLSILVTLLFMALGLLLFIFYARPDVMGAAAPNYAPGDREALLTFILREMPSGLAGLMFAGVCAVSLGSLVSALNAMASSFVNDFYKPLRPQAGDARYLQVGRLATLGAGALLAGFGLLCAAWQTAEPETSLIDFALGVMTFAYAGLVAVFLAALLTRRGNSRSAIAALLTGFTVIASFKLAVAQGWTSLAYPWQMTIATLCSFAVCCAGRPVLECKPTPRNLPIAGTLLPAGGD